MQRPKKTTKKLTTIKPTVWIILRRVQLFEVDAVEVDVGVGCYGSIGSCGVIVGVGN